MDATINFLFREKLYRGQMFVEDSEFPCFVFVYVRDRGLVNEFGDEIAIKTDYEKRLPKKDDFPALIELQEAVFSVARKSTAFTTIKKKWQKANDLATGRR